MELWGRISKCECLGSFSLGDSDVPNIFNWIFCLLYVSLPVPQLVLLSVLSWNALSGCAPNYIKIYLRESVLIALLFPLPVFFWLLWFKGWLVLRRPPFLGQKQMAHGWIWKELPHHISPQACPAVLHGEGWAVFFNEAILFCIASWISYEEWAGWKIHPSLLLSHLPCFVFIRTFRKQK